MAFSDQEYKDLRNWLDKGDSLELFLLDRIARSKRIGAHLDEFGNADEQRRNRESVKRLSNQLRTLAGNPRVKAASHDKSKSLTQKFAEIVKIINGSAELISSLETLGKTAIWAAPIILAIVEHFHL